MTNYDVVVVILTFIIAWIAYERIPLFLELLVALYGDLYNL